MRPSQVPWTVLPRLSQHHTTVPSSVSFGGLKVAVYVARRGDLRSRRDTLTRLPETEIVISDVGLPLTTPHHRPSGKRSQCQQPEMSVPLSHTRQ